MPLGSLQPFILISTHHAKDGEIGVYTCYRWPVVRPGRRERRGINCSLMNIGATEHPWQVLNGAQIR